MRLKNAVLAKTFVSKAFGLMFRNDFSGALVMDLGFETRRGACVHTFFMCFAIDVFFVDEKHRVVDIRHSVMPWRPCILPKKPCRFVVEAKPGTVKAKVGQKLEW